MAEKKEPFNAFKAMMALEAAVEKRETPDLDALFAKMETPDEAKKRLEKE